MHRLLVAVIFCLAPVLAARADMIEARIAYAQRDYNTALREFGALAARGNNLAQYSLGNMHFYGQGVEQNFAEALRWYKKAAESGDARALNAVGRMYRAGMGVTRDYVEALKWFERAAERGHSDAQTQLGVMYFVGMQIRRDHVESLKWLNIASSLGADMAPKYSRIVAARMTKAQIREAQRLADRWLARYLRPR